MTDWPLVRLGDVVDLLTGFPFQSSGYTDDHIGVRLLRGDNVGQGELRWDAAKRWPTAGVGPFAGFELDPEDVILAMDRPWIAAGLKFAPVRARDLPCLLVQRVARLRGGDKLRTSFLRYVIGSASFTEYVKSVQTGTGIPHISGPQIKAFEFPLPTIREQDAIVEVLGSIEAKLEWNGSTRALLTEFARVLAARLLESAGIDARRVRVRDIASLTRGVAYASADLTADNADAALVSLKCFGRDGTYRDEGLKPYTGSAKPQQSVNSSDVLVAHTDL